MVFLLKNKFGIILNLIIIVLSIMIIAYIVKPAFYGANTNGEIIDDPSCISILKGAINNYKKSFVNRDYEALNSMVPFIKFKNQKDYEKISDKYESSSIDVAADFTITEVRKINDNTFIVKYYLKSGYVDKGIINNKLIINFNKRKGTFNVYYDEMLDS